MDPSMAGRRPVPFVLQRGLSTAGSAVLGPASTLSLRSLARMGSSPAMGICPMTDDGKQGTRLNSGLGGIVCPPSQELSYW